MNRRIVPWLLLLVAMAGGIGATYAGCPGCIERGRVNSTCEWIGDTTFVLDAQNRGHQHHLIADAQLAEELAIRYADAEHERLFGTYGHGGLIDHGRVRNECMARLVARIESGHAVTSDQIGVARGRRNWLFDLAVGLLFLLFYGFGATTVCLALRRRFSSDHRHVGLVVTALSSLAASFLGLQFLQLWFAVWEAVRVGNGHMSSFRTATWTHWGQQHQGAHFIGGIFLFWLVAFLSSQGTSGEQVSLDVSTPRGLLLR
jgi:hypothetical protein